MKLRRLTPEDAAAFQALRLTALRDEETSFGSSYDEEKDFPASKVEGRLAEKPDRGAFGAFESDALVGIVVLWSLTLLCAVILQRFTILVMTNAGESVQFDIRRRLFTKLQQLSMSYYDKTKLGRIISRCTSDVNSLREVNVWGLTQVVNNSLMMLFAAVMMAIYTDWRLFLSVAWLAPGKDFAVLVMCNQANAEACNDAVLALIADHFAGK